MALNFPNAPSDGDKYTDPTTSVTYKYNLPNDTWTGPIYGEIYIDPGPGDVTITPNASSGSGTESSPWILEPSTCTDVGGTITSTNTITFAGFDEGNLIKFVDTNANQNGTRFDQPIGQIAPNGSYSTNLTYTDTPNSPIDGTVYTGKLKVGNTTVYFQWAVTQVVTTPLVQSSATTISASSWNPGSSVTMTPGVATGGVAPINYTYQFQKSPNGIDSWVQVTVGVIGTVYEIQNADVGSYIRGSTIATDSGSQQQTLALNSTSSPVIQPGIPVISSLVLSKDPYSHPPSDPHTSTLVATSAATADKWTSVTYGGAKYVSIANNSNKTMYSSDGITWSSTTATTTSGWNSVTYGGGRFAAVSYDQIVMYSNDGINWITGTFTTGNPGTAWASVAYGNGKFVAVGGVSSTTNNYAMYSTDGYAWQSSASGATAAGMSAVTYGNGKFVAVAQGGPASPVQWSADGINWSAGTDAPAGSWTAVTYGGGLFVAVANSGTNRVMYSSNGINWTTATAAENNEWKSVTYGGRSDVGLFVAVSSSATNQMMESKDAINWTISTTPQPATDWLGVTYGDDQFVAVAGSSPTSGSTGQVWYAQLLGLEPPESRFTDQSYTSTITMSEDANSTKGLKAQLVGSFNQIGQTSQITNITPGWNAARGAKNYSSINSFGTFLGYSSSQDKWSQLYSGGGQQSTDGGETWTNWAPATNAMSVTGGGVQEYNGPYAFSVSASGRYYSGWQVTYNSGSRSYTNTLTDADGNNWTPLIIGNGSMVGSAGSCQPFLCNGVMVAGCYLNDTGSQTGLVSNSEALWTSPTGNSYGQYTGGNDPWTKCNIPNGFKTTGQNIFNVAMAYGASPLEGDGQPIWVLPDIATGYYDISAYVWWTNNFGESTTWYSSSIPINHTGIAYGNGVFVIVGGHLQQQGTYGQICYSTDGKTWTTLTPKNESGGMITNFSGVTFANGYFVATTGNYAQADEGEYFWSTDGINWTRSNDGSTENDVTGYSTSILYGGGRFVQSYVQTSGSSGSPPYQIAMYAGDPIMGPGYKLTFQNDKDLDNGLFLVGDIVQATNVRVSGLAPATNQMYVDGGTWAYGEVITNTEPRPLSTYYPSSNITDIGSTASPALTCADSTNMDKFDQLMNITQDGPLTPVTSQITNTAAGWTAVNIGNITFSKVAYGNGIWMAIELGSGASNYLWRSTDNGLNWAKINLTENPKWGAITYGNGTWILVPTNHYAALSAYSTDNGATWAVNGNLASGFWYNCTYGAGKFVATGGPSVGTQPAVPNIAYSSDGINWTTANLTASGQKFTGLAYVNSRFITSSYTGSSAYSTDGVTWSFSNSAPQYGQGGGRAADKYVMGVGLSTGNNARLSYTSDGVTWQYCTVPDSANTQTWDNFVTCGDVAITMSAGNSFMSSLDGITWGSTFSVPGATGSESMNYGNGRLITTWNKAYGGTEFLQYSDTCGYPKLTFQDSTQLNNFQPGDIIVAPNAGSTVVTVSPSSNSMSISGGTWTNGQTVTGPTLNGTGVVSSVSGNTINLSSMPNRFAIGKKALSALTPIDDYKNYAIFSGTGQISGITGTDPGYVVTTDQADPTVTFPAVFASGLTPDAELGVGTSIQTYVEAIGPGGSDTEASNILYPTSASTFTINTTLDQKNFLLKALWEQTKDRNNTYGTRRPKYEVNLLEYIRTSGRGLTGTYDNDAYLKPKGVYSATDGRIYFINLDYAAGTTVDVSIVTTLAGVGVVTLSATGLDPNVSYKSFIATLVTELASNANITYASTDNAITWAAVSDTIQSVVITIT